VEITQFVCNFNSKRSSLLAGQGFECSEEQVHPALSRVHCTVMHYHYGVHCTVMHYHYGMASNATMYSQHPSLGSHSPIEIAKTAGA
jgi:hypothetical protein